VRRHLRLVVALSIALVSSVVLVLMAAGPPSARHDAYACAGAAGAVPRDWCPSPKPLGSPSPPGSPTPTPSPLFP
jgi:hypothetical protein